jgi:hypothetical protein
MIPVVDLSTPYATVDASTHGSIQYNENDPTLANDFSLDEFARSHFPNETLFDS